MKDDLTIKNGIVIPHHELEITTSRSGGPGGQHVNKTNSRITIRWNIPATIALTDIQKERVMNKLQSQLTNEGDLIIHNSTGRSQMHNKKAALEQLVQEVRKALYVPKKRMKTKVSQAVKESRLKEKAQRSKIKKMRSKNYDE